MAKRRRKYLAIARVSLQTALTYRANVMSGFLFYTLFLFVFFCLWRAIYAGSGVEGLTFQQTIWYLCVTELIGYGARTDVFRDTTDKVKNGEIAYQLIRPYRFLSYQAASAVGQLVYHLLCFGMLAFAVGMVMVGPIAGYRLWTLPFALFSMLMGIALNFGFLLLIGLSAFRIEENFGLYLIYQKLVFMLGLFIPVEFLPGWLQGVAKCLPFSYVAWGPARLMVGFDWAIMADVYIKQAFWLIVVFGSAALLYRRMVRGLQGQGG